MSSSQELVSLLSARFCAQVHNALKCELDGTPTSLAFVDYYVAQARTETRSPILSLLAAGAGAYFGELIRTEVGGFWLGDGKDPRKLRLFVEPHFVYFSPFDQAFEAIVGSAIEDDDERHPDGDLIDSAFHTCPPRLEGLTVGEHELSPVDTELLQDSTWLTQELDAIPAVDENIYFSLTGRFETLLLILELMSARHMAAGRSPKPLTLNDYAQLLG